MNDATVHLPPLESPAKAPAETEASVPPEVAQPDEIRWQEWRVFRDELRVRLDRLEVDTAGPTLGAIQRIDTAIGQSLGGIRELGNAVQRTEESLLAPLSAAVGRLELAGTQRHEVSASTLGTLAARLDRIEAQALQAENARSAELQRIEAMIGQIHSISQGVSEANQRTEVAILAPVASAVDRLELASTQRYEAATVALGTLVERLVRLEAQALQAENARSAALERIEAAAARRSPAVDFAPREDCANPFPLRFPTHGAFQAWRDMQTDLPEGEIWAAASPPEVCLLDDRASETTVGVLRDRLYAFVSGRRLIPAGCGLAWLLPQESATLASDAEIEQALGLVGWNIRVVRSGTDGATVATAYRREEKILRIIRWPWSTIEALAAGKAPSLATRQNDLLHAFDLAAALSFTDPAVAADIIRRAAMNLAGAAGPQDGKCVFGLIWPREAIRSRDAARKLCERLSHPPSGPATTFRFQWVAGVRSVDETEGVRALARLSGVALDLTPTVRAQNSGLFAAYDDTGPYRPQPFDLRIPSFAADADRALFCLARADAAVTTPDAVSFDGHARRLAERLALVLDRERQAAFAKALDQGAEQAGAWEFHHVYNWAQPAVAWLRALVADAEDTAILLPAKVPGATAVNVEGLLDRIGALAEARVGPEANMHLQVEAHDYLTERRVPSADSARLAAWLPAKLGETLELGSGYGVLARGFIDRTERYVGLDLTVEQGNAVAALGGLPLIGDFHELPFADAAFDTIIADNVIEHALDPVVALREMVRVMKPAGTAFLVLPLDYLGPDYRNVSHHWKADERSIRAAFAAAGLAVVRSEICNLSEIGATGSFPSCAQTTSLWQVSPGAAAAAPAESASPETQEVIRIDWRAEARTAYGELASIAQAVTSRVLMANAGSNLRPLAKKSPGLLDFDWRSYLELSEVRVLRAVACLRRHGIRGPVLDFGSYFGNFALTMAAAGIAVEAIDSYASYDEAFIEHRRLMEAEGITVHDFADVGYELERFEHHRFEAALCMGVIEHIAHTPRLLMTALDRVIRPNGLLIMDTPNLAYQYQREKLAEGHSVFPPITVQFDTTPPFEGHHREYTPTEVKWMVERIGHESIEIETFNYSMLGLSELSGREAVNYRAMQADPDRRELIFSASRKRA